MKSIATLTMNPTIDISYDVDRVVHTHKMRTRNERYDPGGGGINVARVFARLGGQARCFYLSGGPTGVALDGLLDLRAEHALTLEKVESVDIRVSRDALAPLIHHRPQSGLEAKFSMEYAAAAALLDGGVKLSSFLDSAVLRPEIQAFLPKVTASEQGDTLMPRWAEIAVRRNDGATLTARVSAGTVPGTWQVDLVASYRVQNHPFRRTLIALVRP